MTSIQLECGKVILHTSGEGKLREYVKEILIKRGLDPHNRLGLWKAMINRVKINYSDDLRERNFQ